MQIIPAVDVLGGLVVRLLRGDYDAVSRYADDPVQQCRDWVEAGAGLVHVVDLEGARSAVPDEGLWRRLGGSAMPYQIGGGIRTAALANRALSAGAQRVVMGTAAVWSPGVLREVPEVERLVAAVDVRAGRAVGAGWLDRGREFADVLDGLAEAGVVRVLVTGIDTDGTMSGPDLGLLRSAVADRRFGVIASGGVGSLGDLRRVADLGCEAVIVGRALYEGKFTLEEAREAVA